MTVCCAVCKCCFYIELILINHSLKLIVKALLATNCTFKYMICPRFLIPRVKGAYTKDFASKSSFTGLPFFLLGDLFLITCFSPGSSSLFFKSPGDAIEVIKFCLGLSRAFIADFLGWPLIFTDSSRCGAGLFLGKAR